jgi:hypothetical protein
MKTTELDEEVEDDRPESLKALGVKRFSQNIGVSPYQPKLTDQSNPAYI